MSDATITAEWCEKFAAGTEGMSTVLLTWDGNAKMCAALRLAARALRAKEWCRERTSVQPGCAPSESWEATDLTCRNVLAILNGETP